MRNKGEIKEIFSYDINIDIALVHPKFICNTCRQKLQNYQKEMCKVVQADIATFVSHTRTLCSRKRRLMKHKHSLKKSLDEKEITQKTIEKKMTKEILCAKACHHHFVMTSDTDCFSNSLFYQIMGALVWKYQSECFCGLFLESLYI